MTQFGKEVFAFETHIQSDHYAWNYLAYAYYIHKKPILMRSQIEAFVLEQIYSKDFEWIPNRKTASLSSTVAAPEQQLDDMIELKADSLSEFISQCNAKLRKKKNAALRDAED